MEQLITLDQEIFRVCFTQNSNRTTRFSYKLPNIINVSLSRYHSQSEVIAIIIKQKMKILNSFSVMRAYSEPEGTLCLFGKLYKLEFIKMQPNHLITDEIIYLKDNKNREKAISNFRLLQLKNYIALLSDSYHLLLQAQGIPVIPFKFRTVSTYFGIFRKKKVKGVTSYSITFNTFLSRMDKELIKHVFFHEHAHYLFQNHSRDFYALLSRLDENAALNRKQLRKIAIV